MHSPLDAHLHTPECNKVIKLLQECHANNSKFKQFFFLTCDDLDTQMRKCLKKERKAREANHFKEARLNDKEYAEKYKKQQASGKTWRDLLEEKEKSL